MLKDVTVRRVTFTLGQNRAIVTRKPNEFGEYVVKFYRHATYQREADYFTNDYDDAISTAKTCLERM